MQGKIYGRSRIGRRRQSWLPTIRDWFNSTSSELFTAAASRVQIDMMIAKPPRGDGILRVWYSKEKIYLAPTSWTQSGTIQLIQEFVSENKSLIYEMDEIKLFKAEERK